MYLEMSVADKAKKFEENLLDTNRGYSYYVDWTNVMDIEKYNVEIHALDVLIGCDNDRFYAVFKNLLEKLPTVVEVFPFLFALSKKERDSVVKNLELKIIGQSIDGTDYDVFEFNGKKFMQNINNETICKYYKFFVNMGLKELFQFLIEKSVKDYILGVLVGLDSNGRKNRGGAAFELACEPIIREICDKYEIEVITQKQFKYVEQKYGIKTNEVMANRKADFILISKDKKKCMNIEVNFFNDSGSKPEEIINSYIQRQGALRDLGIGFCLLTDGKCWKGTTNQLLVGFNGLDYLMNYNLAKLGMLEEVIIREFMQ